MKRNYLIIFLASMCAGSQIQAMNKLAYKAASYSKLARNIQSIKAVGNEAGIIARQQGAVRSYAASSNKMSTTGLTACGQRPLGLAARLPQSGLASTAGLAQKFSTTAVSEGLKELYDWQQKQIRTPDVSDIKRTNKNVHIDNYYKTNLEQKESECKNDLIVIAEIKAIVANDDAFLPENRNETKKKLQDLVDELFNTSLFVNRKSTGEFVDEYDPKCPYKRISIFLISLDTEKEEYINKLVFYEKIRELRLATPSDIYDTYASFQNAIKALGDIDTAKKYSAELDIIMEEILKIKEKWAPSWFRILGMYDIKYEKIVNAIENMQKQLNDYMQAAERIYGASGVSSDEQYKREKEWYEERIRALQELKEREALALKQAQAEAKELMELLTPEQVLAFDNDGLYKLFDLKPDACQQTLKMNKAKIKVTYYAISRKIHPDMHKNNTLAMQATQKINSFYESLKNKML